MAVGERPLAHVDGYAGRVEALVEQEPHLVAQPARARGEAVGDGQRVGVAGEAGIVAYGAAAARMADLGPVLGWPLFMSAIILTSNVWGLALGEWKGASRSSLFTMLAGLGGLILGFCTLAWSSRLA